MFEENGDLRDEFRMYPKPKDDDPELEEARIVAWYEANLDRIPDWFKVNAHLDKTARPPHR